MRRPSPTTAVRPLVAAPRWRRVVLAIPVALLLASPACDESAPDGLRRTPDGPGATVRFDLSHQPLPEIPLPNDTATWPDPTSRTGLRINASLVAPTEIEKNARQQFDQLEGWGTFAPISVSFDLAEVNGHARLPTEAALDLDNVIRRHQGDDYDFANDAFYLVDLDTGIPVALDVGNGNFDYTLKRLDKYWPNDTRASERNLLFDTIDETKRGSIGTDTFTAALDTDFDGHLDVPNLDDPFACPDPSPICDDPKSAQYGSETCVGARRLRDRCIADHFIPFYERETDTLILRPIIPMNEMTRYAVVVTDRLRDANGDAVKSPFEFIYHASQEASAARVRDVINDPKVASYYGDIAGTGLDHVAFTWSFTTEPTVDDMKRLRDGLYGQGPFAKFATDFPIKMTVERAVGLVSGLAQGSTETPGWQTSEQGQKASCGQKADNLFIIKADDLKPILKQLITQGFGEDDGPATQELVRTFDAVDYLMIGTYKSPFLLEGGPKSTDPKAAFKLNYQTGEGEITEDTVQFFAIVPKETAQFHQPFDVNIYGHGYTGAFIEEIIYAGNLAKHGLATVGINAMGHGLDFGDAATDLIVKGVLSSVCVAPFNDALLLGRARDLNRDGRVDSGGDFWSSYLFHTRDGVRQSILDHIQLVRILRAFGGGDGQAICQNDSTGWDKPATEACDTNQDGQKDLFGDFDGNGVPDFGGPNAHYGTWGESLGGILSGIHGAIDAYVTAASPGSGGGGLTDIGIRSFQGGVVEAVLLRIWGPLVVTVPASDRKPCTPESRDRDFCTMCSADQISLRWVMPDLNDTGELEIRCVDKSDIQGTTVYVTNNSNNEVRCARVDDGFAMRVGIPASMGDRIDLRFYDKVDQVKDYDSCAPLDTSMKPRTEIASYGPGRVAEGTSNAVGTNTCNAPSCSSFQGIYYGEGDPLVAPAEGLGQIRQTPSLRRFIQLAQAALDPGDPINFAPYYAIKPMTDPFGDTIAPHAVITLNTIGDMNVPLNSGIAFARATGAVPFMRPDQAALYPEYASYVTPKALYDELGGKTPNRMMVDSHVIEGVTKLARHPAAAGCATSANAKPLDGTWIDAEGQTQLCFPSGCTDETEMQQETRVCFPHSHCDAGQCVPDVIGAETCEEALFDADDLDEGAQLYFEQAAPSPLRLVRYTEAATVDNLSHVWEPRLLGKPHSADGGWTPSAPVTGLLDAYIVPGGVHTFTNGNPCENFDAGTYLTNLVARFFMSNGSDVYYLSHPTTHHCLGDDLSSCGYLTP